MYMIFTFFTIQLIVLIVDSNKQIVLVAICLYSNMVLKQVL